MLEIFDTPPLSAWSFSRLEVFERCPMRAALKFVKKTEEANDPKRDDALQRGRDVHDKAELYVRGELTDLPKELKKFEKNFEKHRDGYMANPEKYILEEQWAFDKDWQPCDWYDENVWVRMILDRGVWHDDEKTALEICDYKTGKKEGNEVKHGAQGQLFVVGCFMKYPTLQVARCVFEYLDHGKTSLPKVYTREQAMKFLASFERRGKAMTEAVTFPPKPNRINCAWCPYGPSRGNGACEYGVESM
jgi:RecB family exonuclease